MGRKSTQQTTNLERAGIRFLATYDATAPAARQVIGDLATGGDSVIKSLDMLDAAADAFRQELNSLVACGLNVSGPADKDARRPGRPRKAEPRNGETLVEAGAGGLSRTPGESPL